MLPRTQHAAAQGGDGRIYITGGLEAYANVSSNGSVAFEFYSAPMTDTLVYDINTGWDIKNTTGDIPSERMFHTMVTCKLNSCKRFSYLVEKKNARRLLFRSCVITQTCIPFLNSYRWQVDPFVWWCWQWVKSILSGRECLTTYIDQLSLVQTISHFLQEM